MSDAKSNTRDMTDTNTSDMRGDPKLENCVENTKYTDAKAILQGGKVNPTGRGEQGAIFDVCNQRVILFGGNDEQPQQCANFGLAKNYLGDTWAYSLEFKNWYRIKPKNAPSARGRFAYAFDSKRKNMVIFGGWYRSHTVKTGNYTPYNETWSFDVNTDEWTKIETKNAPIARVNTAMVYDETNDQFILFGGNKSPNLLAFKPLNDTWIYTPSDQTWTLKETTNTPPIRLYHTMVMDTKNNRVLIYGGGGVNSFQGPFMNDLWALDLNTFAWEKLFQGDNTESTPNGRINGTMIEASGKTLLFAGHDDLALGNDNDLWEFNLESNTFNLLDRGDVYTGAGCTAFCECSENFVSYDLDAPERRSYPSFVSDPMNNQVILFGGTGDCGYMDDTWYLHLDAATWEEVHPAEQGIACARARGEGCTDLCF